MQPLRGRAPERGHPRLAVGLVESSPRWRHAAAQIRATYSLSLTDAWIASLAILRSAHLVHRDPELDAIEGLRSLRLPDR